MTPIATPNRVTKERICVTLEGISKLKLIRIALAVNRNYGYYRDVLRGIVRYAETKPEWHFISIAPEQSSLQGLRKLNADFRGVLIDDSFVEIYEY